jgi:hypothetical protein
MENGPAVAANLNFGVYSKKHFKRHLEGRKRARVLGSRSRAAFAREWEERASSPERPCVYLSERKVPRPYSGADESAPSWTGSRDDDLSIKSAFNLLNYSN